MNRLTFDEFLRSLKQNKDTAHSFFLGAGASVESGIQSATDCIWDWKREIYISQNPHDTRACNNTKIESVRRLIQRWIDEQNTFPPLNDETEYSTYAQKAYPIEDDRKKYFQRLFENKKPSLGYHLLAMLAEIGWARSVWTTNFDGLTLKVAHQYNVVPIEVTLESQQRIYRAENDKELLCIALHGDYKYGPLKNTATELDVQSDILVDALKQELSRRNLIVIGYSGRDRSIMNALNEAYSQPGVGRLYWCGYGENIPQEVESLLNSVEAKGRQAYYISTDGFDKTMLLMSKYCMNDDINFSSRIDKLLNELGDTIDYTSTPFKQFEGNVNNIAKTNLYPIAFPKTCYQFKLSFKEDERAWDICKSLNEQGIVAVPNSGLVYAWGNKEVISKACLNRLESDVEITAFSRDLIIKNKNFREMLLRGITMVLAQATNCAFSKDKIWDNITPENKFYFNIHGEQIFAYYGVKLSLKFDYKYTYLSFEPAYHFCNDIKYENNTLKSFADAFSMFINGKAPNLNINNYIDKWVNNLLGVESFVGYIPIQDKDGFEFKIRASSVLVGINNARGFVPKLPNTINPKRIILKGIECKDPELVFFNPSQNTMHTDFHPMRGLTNNSPYDFALGSKISRASISLGVICPINHSKDFQLFLNELNNKHSVRFNTDYVIPFPGFFNAFNIGLNVPLISNGQWVEISPPNNSNIALAINEFRDTILQQIDKLSSQAIDVVVIYIPKEYECFTEQDNYNLHDVVKAYAAQKNIATQFIREKTVEESGMRCQIMWALSLAIYVKSCHIPWVISAIRPDTAFAGIGYSINSSKYGTNIVIGCSHIYSSDGQGLKYKLSKIKDFYLDKKNNPFLTESESYNLGLNIKDLFYKSFTELPKRVVIHKRTPFKKEEIDGLVKCLSSAGISDIQLLEINYEDNMRSFAYEKNFNIDTFPVRRGLCFPMDEKTMLLYTHGIAPSVRNPNFKYIQGGKTVPIPLKIVKHYGSGDMAQIATEILGLSKMNWNSFGLYSKLPCTIESSNQLARIGWLLSQYEGTIYDYRFFM